MNADEHLTDGRIRYRYPTPIAVPYRLSRIARAPEVRLGQLLGAVDQTTRFACWILLSDYLAATVHEPRDPAVEEALGGLEHATTPRVAALLAVLVQAPTPSRAFLPELREALDGAAGAGLFELVEAMTSTPLRRSALARAEAGALHSALLPRLTTVLEGLACLESTLLVRPMPAGGGDRRTWALQPWRGTGPQPPLLVRLGAMGDVRGESTLLVRGDGAEALRLDPLLVFGGDGRLLGLLGAPGMRRVRYEHHPSGRTVTWDVPLDVVLRERDLQLGRVPLDLDSGSVARLARLVAAAPPALPGYDAAVGTGTDALGDHFRAIHVASSSLHSVLRIHDHVARDPESVGGLLGCVDALLGLDHPAVAPPVTSGFDSESGGLIIGFPQPAHGRLADRIPLGARLPVRWALRVAASLLDGLQALAGRGILLRTLPPEAITVHGGGAVRVVPTLAERGGRPEDGPRAVATLLYRMLVGERPATGEPLPPSDHRKAVPEELDLVVMQGLRGQYADAEAMATDLRAADGRVPPEPPHAATAQAIQRTYAHLQRLAPDDLDDRRAALDEVLDDVAELVRAVDSLVDDLWDPDDRLEVARRLPPEVPGAEAVLRKVHALAEDHPATLHFVAERYATAVRGEDLERIWRRMLTAADSGDEVCLALGRLAHLCEERGDLRTAEGYLQRVLEARPENRDALEGLARIHRRQVRRAALAEDLAALLRRQDGAPEARADLLRELAARRAGPLGEPRGALPLLDALAEADEVAPGIHEVSRDLARDLRDDDRLVRALEALGGCEGLSEDARWHALLERAIVLGLRLNRPDEAVAALEERLRRRPGDRVAASYRAQILERAGRWPEAAEALERWGAIETEPGCLALALRRLAAVAERHLEDRPRAARIHEAVLEIEPTDPAALGFLDAWYEEHESWSALVRVLETRSEGAQGREHRQGLLRRLAMVYDRRLEDPEGGLRAYGRLLLEAPQDEAALERFAELADVTEGWEEADPVIERVLPHLEPDAAHRWRHRFGRIRLDHGQDLSRVVAMFRQEVAERPDDVAALEGLLAATARVGQWDEHAAALERLAELEETVDGRVSRLLRLAETTRDRLLDPRRAAQVLGRVLQSDPDNVAGLAALVRVDHAAGRAPGARVSTLRRWIELCADPLDRLEALEALVALGPAAELSPGELAETHRAILQLDPANPEALRGLEELHRRKGEWSEVAAILEQRIGTAPAAEEGRLRVRLCEVMFEHLGDAEGAEALMATTLEQDPSTPGAWELQEHILTASGRFDRLADVLEARAEAATAAEERVELLYRMARVRGLRLGDVDGAVEAMERVLAVAPGHRGALGFLGQHYRRLELWEDARRVLEALAAAVETSPPHDPPRDAPADAAGEAPAAIWADLAEVRRALGEPEPAREAWQRALEHDPASGGALRGLAELAFERREYDVAETFYRQVLERFPELSSEQLAELHSALGEIALARGDDRQSRTLLERSVAQDPARVESLRELIAVCERQRDWEASGRYRRQLLARVHEPLARFAELVALADLLRDHLGDDEGARAALEEARLLKPDSVAVPMKLLEVHLAVGNTKDAIHVLHGLIERTAEPERRAKYTFTLALLYRDHVHDPGQAVRFLDETLDLDPGKLEAFEALDRLLARQKDVRAQAESYERMIGRLGDAPDRTLAFRLWRNLARLYRQTPEAQERAVAALAIAAELDPVDLEVRSWLAEALEAQDPASTAAIEQHRRILTADPSHLASWHAMARLFRRSGRPDGAWCACGVLDVLGKAEDEERSFYEKHRHPALALRRSLEGPGQWELQIFDPAQDRVLGRTLEILARALGDQLGSRTASDLELSPHDVVSLNSKSRFVGFLATVAKILRVPIPIVYRSTRVRGIVKRPVGSAVMVAGPELLGSRKGKELRFLLGKGMAFFLPQHLMAGLYPAGHLRTLVLGAISVTVPELDSGNEPGVRGIAKLLKRALGPEDRKRLRVLCQELAGRQSPIDVELWLRHVECAANHAGHLLCNDLDVSVRMMREEREGGQRWSRLTLKEAIEDLALYTVSDAFLALREQLGAAITD